MKLIGITGKMGAGKTTLSNMLQEYPGVMAIHVDDLVDVEKESKFSKMMDKDEDGNPVVVKQGLKNLYIPIKIYLELLWHLKVR